MKNLHKLKEVQPPLIFKLFRLQLSVSMSTAEYNVSLRLLVHVCVSGFMASCCWTKLSFCFFALLALRET